MNLALTAFRPSRKLRRRNPDVESVAAAAAHARGLLETDPMTLADATEMYAMTPRLLARASALGGPRRRAGTPGRARRRRQLPERSPAHLLRRRRELGRLTGETTLAHAGNSTPPREGDPTRERVGQV
jgi:hypothetical protein